MPEPKTRPTQESVEDYINAIADDVRRQDATTVCEMLIRVSGERPVMWGTAIIGFGQQRLRYASGRELDWPVISFAPRKAQTTIYLSGGLDTYADLLARLGKHTVSGGCLHIKRLDAVDAAVLEALLSRSVAQSLAMNP